jgi:phosphopantothenoylcysteine decarboxylase/phosphopantothenate--cysteine ligase
MRPGRRLKLVISAGPTREPIDPVRFISNYSTGYMGSRLAVEALARGHGVVVVRGPTEEPMPAGARVVAVETSDEMARALRREAARADAVLMAAAVCDFQPLRVASRKLARRAHRSLRLQATPDLIAELPRRTGQVRAGFALETGAVIARAQRKLRAKRLDLVLAQRANGEGPFGRRSVRAWLVDRQGHVAALGARSKQAIARLLLDKVEALWYGQHRSMGRQN